MITDAGIFVNQSEYFSELLNSVKLAGFQRVVVFSQIPFEDENLISGYYVTESTVKGLTNAVKKAPKKALIAVDAGDNSFNRAAITMKGVSLIGGLESLPKAGFDHITAKMAADNNVGLVIEIGKILNPKTRRRALTQYAAILKLQRKYRFPLVIASAAHTALEVRNIHEIIALCNLFGMGREEVYSALESLDGIISPRVSVEVIE